MSHPLPPAPKPRAGAGHARTYPVPLSGKLGTGRSAPGKPRLGSGTQTEARGSRGGCTQAGSAWVSLGLWEWKVPLVSGLQATLLWMRSQPCPPEGGLPSVEPGARTDCPCPAQDGVVFPGCVMSPSQHLLVVPGSWAKLRDRGPGESGIGSSWILPSVNTGCGDPSPRVRRSVLYLVVPVP